MRRTLGPISLRPRACGFHVVSMGGESGLTDYVGQDCVTERTSLLDVRKMFGVIDDHEARAVNQFCDELRIADGRRLILRTGDHERGRLDAPQFVPEVEGANRFEP